MLRVARHDDSWLEAASNSSEQYQDQQNNDDESEAAATIIARAVERSASDAAKAAKKCDNQDNKNDCSNRHLVLLQPMLGTVLCHQAGKQTGTWKVPVLRAGVDALFFVERAELHLVT
jgi:hypothetical protein